MRKLNQEEAAKILEDMKVKIEIPKAAVTQWERNTALDMAIEALKFSEIPNNSDCISRQATCEYCHEDSEGYVKSIEKNSHAWLVRRGRIMKLRVGFKGEHSECDILFCPMCGRELSHG